MRKVFVVVSALLLLAIIAQFYLAAMGAFTKPPDGVRPNDSFALHAANAYIVIPGLSVLATIAAAIARAPGRLIGLSFVPFILTHVQGLFVALAGAAGATDASTTPLSAGVFALHGLNALVILWISVVVLRRARAHMAAGAARAAAPVTESVHTS
jgi:hypothetical protein